MNYQFLLETFFVALSGVPIALLVTVVALVIALPLGFLLALTRINKIPVIHHLAKIYVSFVRGTPIIIQIFIIYSSIPLMLKIIFEKYHIAYDIYKINPIWYAFTFNLGSIMFVILEFRMRTLSVALARCSSEICCSALW